MDESIIDNTEEELLAYEISDAEIEIAAGAVRDGTAASMVIFCSGLDYCSPR